MLPWTIVETIRRLFAAIKRQPLRALLALMVVPTLWWVPAERIQSALFPVGADDIDRSPQAIAFGWVIAAWGTVWFPGQLRAAIDAVRGERIRWRPFVQLLKKAPALFVAGTIVLLPMDLAALGLPSRESADTVSLSFFVMALSIYLIARTMLWAPILLDTGSSFRDGLATSWRATRGHTARIIALGLVLALFIVPVAVVEALLFVDFYPVSMGAIGVIYALATAQLYSYFTANVASAPVEAQRAYAAAASDPASDADQPRESGAGWSRPIRRD